ncbi:MAG: hypothetical protein K9M03_04800 [Kiritimatiellales bacterium]|nr:hypothetical protein [Kiritimatiellales bacterium]
MADTTKLAGTFDAWRLILRVDPINLAAAIIHCVQLGLMEPRTLGLHDSDIQFQVNVPKGVRDKFEELMQQHEASTVDARRIKLMCPSP